MKLLKGTIIAILLITAILIGSPISYNCLSLNFFIILVGIIFCIYKVIKKEKVLNDKLDLCLFIFSLMPIIPIVFNTYISLNDSIISLLKYISCFVIYLIIKNCLENEKKIEYTNKNNEYKNILINIIIFSAVLISIIGIDNSTTRYFTDILEKLGLPYVVNIEHRMFSSLGYANSFAIILAVSVLLILDRINNKRRENNPNRRKKNIEILYSGALFLNLSCILLSYSRTTLVLLATAIIAYLIIDRNKSKNIYTIYILVLDGIISLGYVMVWNEENIWILTIALYIIACLMLKLLDKLYNRISKITKKTYIIIISICIIGISIFIGVGINLTIPLSIYGPNESSSMVKYKIQNIESNKEYILDFDILSKATVNNIENYKITVSEENKYYDTVEEHEISFNNYEGIKEIKFTSSNETVELAIYIESEFKIAQLGLTINSLTINGEIHPLKYLYLPVSLVDKLKDINIKDKSVWERGSYYQDALKISKSHIFTGQGGNAWKYSYQSIQTYKYSATEVHSYFLQILLENGILQVVLYVFILIMVLLKLRQDVKKKQHNSGIYIALFLLVLHSFVDFDMSFYYIMMLFYILLALLGTYYSEKKTEDNKALRNTRKNIIQFIIIIVILIGVLTLGFINAFYNGSGQNELVYTYIFNKQYNDAINKIKQINQTEKENNYVNMLSSIDYSDVTEDNIKYIIESLKEQKITVDVEYNMQRNNALLAVAETAKNVEIKKEVISILISENEENVNMIKNKEKNRLMDNEIKIYLNEQEKIYNSALEILK